MFKSFLLFAVLVLAAGCATKKLTIRPEGEPLFGEERKQLVAEIYKRSFEVNSFRALANVTLTSEDSIDRFRQVFVLERPDRLRVEVLPMRAFYALALTVAKDDNVTVLDVNEKIAMRGPLNPRSVKRILGVPLTYEELFSLLTGRVPRYIFSEGGELVEEKYSVLRARDSYFVAAHDKSLVAEIGSQNFLVRRISKRDQFNDSATFAVYFDEESGFPLALSASELPIRKRLTINLPSDVTAVMTLSDGVFNKEINPDLFEVAIPADYSTRNF